jgi:DNA-binding transcriptional ArsR family regulator
MKADVLPEPPVERLDLVTVLAALADPWRLCAVKTLHEASKPAYCSQVMAESGFNVSKSTVSHHMRVLREAGITRTTVIGSRRYIVLRYDDVNSRFPGLLDAVIGSTDPDGPQREPLLNFDEAESLAASH